MEYIDVKTNPPSSNIPYPSVLRVWDNVRVIQDSAQYDANPDFQTYGHPYAICNEYGCLAIVFATNEQDALNDAVNSGALNAELIAPEDLAEAEEDERVTFYGDAGESFDLTNVQVYRLVAPKFDLFALYQADETSQAE